jgi:Lrp/AsnC family leucine-responsive transcriptional regulator
MVKIDLKDRKILYHLDLDSRKSYSQIGRNVGLPKNIVEKRIKRLIKEGIIKNFYTVIDVYKLGYILMRFHYKYQDITPEIEKEIIDYFKNDKFSVLIASSHGIFNLKLIRLIKDINEFYNIWQDTQRKYGHYFQDRSSALFINEIYYDSSFLLLDNYDKKQREKFTLRGRGKRIEIDDLDKKILRLLSSNARLSPLDIARKLESKSSVISNRIKKLQESEVIKGYRVYIDISKLGYHIFRAYISLKDYSLRDEIINYIKYNPNLVFIDTYTGEADLELEFYFENVDSFTKTMQDITIKFPNAMRYYRYLNIINYHRFLYMPVE